MPLYALKEFASACGVPTNYLSVHIKRGKVNVIGEGDARLIDDTDMKNAAYLAERLRSQAKKDISEAGAPEVLKNPVAATKEPTVGKKKDSSTPLTADEAYKLELREQALDIEIKEQKARYEKIKADKAEGSVIPTELMKSLLLQDKKSTFIEVKNMLEDFVTIMGSKYRATKEDISEMRKKALDGLNAAIKNSSNTTKGQLQNIIAEFSEARGRGEKD